jgi:predicted secreted Zn-dependent protease
MSIELNCDDKTSEVVIKCFFNRNKSWTKEKKSDYLLEHEQLHFDITELFVRKLRKQLNDLGNNCKRLNSHIEHYYKENYKEFVAYQNAYDNETKHSLDTEKQKLWKEKIARELDRLKPFASLASR